MRLTRGNQKNVGSRNVLKLMSRSSDVPRSRIDSGSRSRGAGCIERYGDVHMLGTCARTQSFICVLSSTVLCWNSGYIIRNDCILISPRRRHVQNVHPLLPSLLYTELSSMAHALIICVRRQLQQWEFLLPTRPKQVKQMLDRMNRHLTSRRIDLSDLSLQAADFA